MVSQGEENAQMLHTKAMKSEQKLTETMGELKKEMQSWVQATIPRELSDV